MDIHEHRAPTDESIKIFNDLKEKASASVLDSLIVKNNRFDTELAVFLYAEDYSKIVSYKMMINGKPLTGKFKIPSQDVHDWEKILELVLSNFTGVFLNGTFSSNSNAFYELMKDAKWKLNTFVEICFKQKLST